MESAPRRSSRVILSIVAAAGVLVAGASFVGAQTAPSPGASAGAGPKEKGFHHRRGFRALHGEAVVPGPDDSHRTVARQTGEATSVSQSSISVKSEDGFTRTYTVDEDTMVTAGRDGIDDVKKGDRVAIFAVVSDGKAKAVKILDLTNLKRLHEQARG